MKKVCIISKNKTWANCGSEYEHFIAKFKLKLKIVGKTGPFRCDINQIPYEYAVEVTNRFKGLDLVDRVPVEQTFLTLYKRQQSIPKKKKCKKAKWLSEEALQRRDVQSEEKKGKRHPTECRVPETSTTRAEDFLK